MNVQTMELFTQQLDSEELFTKRISFLTDIKDNMFLMGSFSDDDYSLVECIKQDMNYLYQHQFSVFQENEGISDKEKSIINGIEDRLRKFTFFIVMNYELLEKKEYTPCSMVC